MLTVYGIETAELSIGRNATSSVATVLTVYGIETRYTAPLSPKRTNLLQQCLPFTVLKRNDFHNRAKSKSTLQQCLPFTVLKRVISLETPPARLSCNSAYRLRY